MHVSSKENIIFARDPFSKGKLNRGNKDKDLIIKEF